MLESPNQFSLSSPLNDVIILHSLRPSPYEWKTGRKGKDLAILLLYFFLCLFLVLLFSLFYKYFSCLWKKNVFSYLKLRICQLLMSE